MGRRTFVGAMVALLVMPLIGVAQEPGKVYRIGFLREGTNPIDPSFWDAMRVFGWVEGRNIKCDARYAQSSDQLRTLAAELVERKVDVILTNGTPPTQAAKEATQSIPIVFFLGGDPVESRLVASLSHPGGNVTGQTMLTPDLSTKYVELLKEAVPTLSHLAMLWEPPAGPFDLKRVEDAAAALGVTLQAQQARTPAEYRDAFAAMNKRGAEALIVFPTGSAFVHRKLIADLAASARLPTIGDGQLVMAGGLMAYMANRDDMWRRTAAYVDRLLKGAKPSDLPVERPTKFELIINLKTAKALGLTIPQSLLLRADEVIR
jgi:putative ABC transport system substrate-binding protein